jgi:hypothetical protein
MKRRALRIGITIGLTRPDESLWINGIKQNALFLAKLFRHSPLGHDVVLMNTTDVPLEERLPWRRDLFPTMSFDEGRRDRDVVIELGGQIGPEDVRYLKSQGTKLVSYCCGPEYVQNAEAIIFRRRLWDSIFVNTEFDELWVIPQVAETSLSFLQTFRRCPARIVPFVWDSYAIDEANARLQTPGEYRPGSSEGKRLSILEPNIDVLKFCLYPILVAERAFRERPEKISFLHVANADAFVHDDREFAQLMRHLDIVKAQRASFIGRVDTPWFLTHYTDVVISHQWGLPLNYLYLECCWLGYPFVHNAPLIADLGYFYAGNDVAAGAEALLAALDRHDERWIAYRNHQRSKMTRFLATSPPLIEAYDDLLSHLFDR